MLVSSASECNGDGSLGPFGGCLDRELLSWGGGFDETFGFRINQKILSG